MAEKKNPTAGYDNPFYRENEHHFDGGELTIKSPVNSIFDEVVTRKDGSNTMEDVLKEQAPGSAKKSVTGRKGKK